MKAKFNPKLRGHGQALLVIDIQIGLFKKSTQVYHSPELLANINSLIERARRSSIPVIYIQHCNESFLQKDSPDWQLHPDLLPPGESDLRIYKHHGSAFDGTSLEQELDERRVGALVMCGLVTHGCVKAACLDACQKGFLVTLAADGHSSNSKDAASLVDEWNAKLAQAGAQVLPAGEIEFAPQAAIA